MNNDMTTIFGRKGWMLLSGPCTDMKSSWKAGQCLRCGAQVMRQRKDDADHNWKGHFAEGLYHHETVECTEKAH